MNILDYDDYYKASLKLLTQIFGKKLVNQLKKQPVKPIDWDGADITCNDILVCTANIKGRFTENYMREDDDNMLELFIRSVFHYGYDQCYNFKVADLEEQITMLRLTKYEMMSDKLDLLGERNELKDEIDKLKEEILILKNK